MTSVNRFVSRNNRRMFGYEEPMSTVVSPNELKNMSDEIPDFSHIQDFKNIIEHLQRQRIRPLATNDSAMQHDLIYRNFERSLNKWNRKDVELFKDFMRSQQMGI